MNKIIKVIRPHGLSYIIYEIIMFSLLLGASLCMIVGSLSEYYDPYTHIIIMIIFYFTVLLIIMFEIRKCIQYKVILEDDSIVVAAEKELWGRLHGEIILNFKGIKALQYR